MPDPFLAVSDPVVVAGLLGPLLVALVLVDPGFKLLDDDPLLVTVVAVALTLAVSVVLRLVLG